MAVDNSMKEIIKKYPAAFTGETMVVPDPTPEQQAATVALMEELKTLAAPLVEWIRENHGYHTEIHISADLVCVKHDGMGIPYPISEK